MKNLIQLLGSSVLVLSSQAFAEDAPQLVSGAAAAAQPAPNGWINIVFLGAIFLVLWFFMIRPNSKRLKEQKDFLASLSAGTSVVTNSGLIGSVLEVRENAVLLSIESGSVMVLKSSIVGPYVPAVQVLSKN